MLADNEPDEEVQDLLRASPGRNLGVDFLPGSLDLDARAFAIDPAFAGRVLWFDALVGNVDRSWRNPNMLFWHGAPYLIDHGAALTFHHNWTVRGGSRRPYDAREHALLGAHPDLDAADEPARCHRRRAGRRRGRGADEWLVDDPASTPPDAVRAGLPATSCWPALADARAEWLDRDCHDRGCRSSTRCCASCRVSSAASRSTPA